MEAITPLEYVFRECEDFAKMSHADQVEQVLFKRLVTQLDALSWPSFVARALLCMGTDPSFDFVVKSGKDLAAKLVKHPYVDPKPFADVLNLCETMYWTESEMQDVLSSKQIARFDAHSGRECIFAHVKV
jgi:hypothetical protein